MSKKRLRKPSDKRNRRAIVFARDGHRCVFCGATDNLTLDHRVPLARGGSNKVSNLQTACLRCNHAKADKPHHVVQKRRSDLGMTA